MTQLTGIIVPSDTNRKIRVHHGTIQELCKQAGWNYFEIVRTFNGRDHDFVMLVNDDARSEGNPYNPRAQYLSGYPIQSPILGDALFLSEAWIGDGYDCINISAKGQAYIREPSKWAEVSLTGNFQTWRIAMQEPIQFYEGHYPQPVNKCEGHAGDTDAELLSGAPMGEMTYCDGSCKK